MNNISCLNELLYLGEHYMVTDPLAGEDYNGTGNQNQILDLIHAFKF
jgi:hypothetical protein